MGRWVVAFVAVSCGFDRGTTGNAVDAPAPPAPDGDPAQPDAADMPPDAGTPWACSASGLACPGQPATVIQCGGTGDCWVGCTNGNEVSFSDAKARCDAWRAGSRLTPVYSLGELACVRGALNEGAQMIGLVQASGESAPTTGWSWNGDGATLVFSHWDGGQPSDGDGIESDTENCAFSEGGSDGAWHDTPCTDTLSRFSCRYP